MSDPDTWPIQCTVADQWGLDVVQLATIIRTHYRSRTGNAVDVLPGGHGTDYPAWVLRIRDRKEST